MLAKLIKQEIIATRRMIPLVYLVAAVMVAGNLLVRKLGIQWLSGILLFLLIVTAISIILMTYVVVVARYYKNLYSPEGYLMHTLPVKPGRLMQSKLIVAFCWMLISYLLTFAVVLVIVYLVMGDVGMSPIDMLRNFQAQAGLNDSQAALVALSLFGMVILSILLFLSEVYFAISLGSISKLHSLNIAAPIIVYLITDFVVQIWILIGLAFVPAGIRIDQNRATFIWQGMIASFSGPSEKSVILGLGSILFLIIAIIALHLATQYVLKNKTSLK